MFDINLGELVILGVLAAVLIGPERLPHYVGALARLVRRARSLADDARQRIDDELGPQAHQIDWSMLDLRRYDPRTLVRDALLDEAPVARTPRHDGGGPGSEGAAAGTAGGSPSPRAP